MQPVVFLLILRFINMFTLGCWKTTISSEGISNECRLRHLVKFCACLYYVVVWMFMHTKTRAQSTTAAGKRTSNRILPIDFRPVSPSRSVSFFSHSSKSTELHQRGETKKKKRKKKIKHQIFRLTWRREAFCAHAPTSSHHTERKISFWPLAIHWAQATGPST